MKLRIAVAVSLLGGLFGAWTLAADRSASAMGTAAKTFLASLDAAQRQKATFSLDSDEWQRWHYIPTGPAPMHPRNGLPLKDMNPSQQKSALGLLRSGLSDRGYGVSTAIMELESILRVIEAAQGRVAPPGTFSRDPLLYFVSVFGDPSSPTWGWRIEGHHLSLHFLVANSSVTVSAPTFFGTNPAEVRDGPRKGLRLLAAQEDAARDLLGSFDKGQQARALFATEAPSDIVTVNRPLVDPLPAAGISAGDLSEKQRALLTALIDVYAGAMAEDIRTERLNRIRKAGLDKISFAWAGGTERGKKHYYRLQGPTFLIEYDNTQNDGNHVHSVWRDFNGDFGRDVLREHLRTARH
jgi:hypothetical protein